MGNAHTKWPWFRVGKGGVTKACRTAGQGGGWELWVGESHTGAPISEEIRTVVAVSSGPGSVSQRESDDLMVVSGSPWGINA